MNKKIITIFFISILIFSFFSGCILRDFFSSGLNFTIVNWSVSNDEGFPSIDIRFQSNNKINLETYNSKNGKIDEEFFYGNDNATLKIGLYHETLYSEEIILKSYDDNDELIEEKSFSFNGPNLEIYSYKTKIWEKQDIKSLMGIELELYNSGDTPVYPIFSSIAYNSNLYENYILPCCILPNSIQTTAFFVYINDIEYNDIFNLKIKDVNDILLIEENMSFINNEILETTKYDKGLDETLTLPIIDFLYNYYDDKNLYLEDYAAFVFDRYDDKFINFLKDELINTMEFSEFFDSLLDSEKINSAASFVQNLKYRKDCDGDIDIEDPQYPADTLYNNGGQGGGDCEDKAILTVSILDALDYNVSLIRIPDHMAIGVDLGESLLHGYDYYIENYYFLDTSADMELGFVHQDYRNPDSIDVYPINSRPLIYHYWRDNSSTIYTDSSGQVFLKVVVYIENLGRKKAENLMLKGIFYTKNNLQIAEQTLNIDDIEPFMKEKLLFTMDVPKGITCNFDTRIYLDGKLVDTETSQGEFSYH
jgi:hypothetical protein